MSDTEQIKAQLNRAYYNGLDRKGWSSYEEADAIKKIEQAIQPTHPVDEEQLICPVDNFEHRIGQNYDERRGTGNGPQICLKCKKTLQELVAAHLQSAVTEARIQTIEGCITSLSFEGMKLTPEQEESLRNYQEQLEAQLKTEGKKG